MYGAPIQTFQVDQSTEDKENERTKPFTSAQENTLLEFMRDRFTPLQLFFLPYVLQHYTVSQIAQTTGKKAEFIERERDIILRKLRFIFTLGVLQDYGSNEQVIRTLVELTSETPSSTFIQAYGDGCPFGCFEEGTSKVPQKCLCNYIPTNIKNRTLRI